MRAGYDYIGVGVGAIVFNEAGEVFLARRGPRASNERGTWEFPGYCTRVRRRIWYDD